MAPPSKSEVDQYYKSTAINIIGAFVALGIYFKFLYKKNDIMSFVLFLFIFGGIMYFQYKDGYMPLRPRIWWTQQ